MNSEKSKRTYILLSVFALSMIVTLVDAFLKPDYTPKVLVKICFFLILPLFYFIINKSERVLLKNLFRFKKETLLKALGIGALIYGVIVGGYFLTRNVIDFSNVTSTLNQNHGITGENFLYVSLYISVLNSFLEEFFFRGFGFLALKAHVSRKFAYVFSPTLFAVYHVGMMIGMFSWWVLAILFLGLFAGGCIFNYLNEAGESIYTSWLAHMCANFAINTVGFILFGLL